MCSFIVYTVTVTSYFIFLGPSVVFILSSYKRIFLLCDIGQNYDYILISIKKILEGFSLQVIYKDDKNLKSFNVDGSRQLLGFYILFVYFFVFILLRLFFFSLI